jgi:hypothetical protein
MPLLSRKNSAGDLDFRFLSPAPGFLGGIAQSRASRARTPSGIPVGRSPSVAPLGTKNRARRRARLTAPGRSRGVPTPDGVFLEAAELEFRSPCRRFDHSKSGEKATDRSV